MSKKGKSIDTPTGVKNVTKTIRNSYIYKILKRFLSILCTLLLISLLVLGAMMFYFNMKAKAAQESGQNYTAPFGLYTIISGSMEPNIRVYDVVAVKQVEDLNNIKVGDIITFVSNWDLNFGKTVTHRVVSISKTAAGEYQFTTKGDNNQSTDGAIVTQNNLIGKVLFRIPQLGRLQFFLATKMGWFIVVFIPALAIIIMDIIKIAKLRLVKDKIEDIKDVEEADKTVFENEQLDNRDIGEADLTKTVAISTEEVKELAHPKLKDEPKKETTNKRAPLKKRTKNN